MIEIEGGNIQRIVTDQSMQIVVINRDNIALEQSAVQRYEPTEIHNGKFQTLFGDSVSDENQQIYEDLKNLDL
jgi:hypothetical protein